jgi:hypothetical protein
MLGSRSSRMRFHVSFSRSARHGYSRFIQIMHILHGYFQWERLAESPHSYSCRARCGNFPSSLSVSSSSAVNGRPTASSTETCGGTTAWSIPTQLAAAGCTSKSWTGNWWTSRCRLGSRRSSPILPVLMGLLHAGHRHDPGDGARRERSVSFGTDATRDPCLLARVRRTTAARRPRQPWPAGAIDALLRCAPDRRPTNP